MTVSPFTDVSPRQIKAARALLDWSQEKLAQLCGVSIATIRKIESGDISSRQTTLRKIRATLEGAGLEFIEPSGVREKPEDLTIFSGHQGTVRFFDEVYQTVLRDTRDVLVVTISEAPLTHAMGEYTHIHSKRMLQLIGTVSVKCIIMEDYDDTPSPYCEYRAITRSYIDAVPFYIYGNNYAIFLFDAEPAPKIIVHHSALLANAYRRQFFSMWDKATLLREPILPPPPCLTHPLD